MTIQYFPMWNRGERAVRPIRYEKGQHRHDNLPGFCGPVRGEFSIAFTAQNAFGVEEPTTLQETWVETKKNYPDSVILVKIGKFYEVFHRDADIIVDNWEGGLYMSGKIAHTGFPESVLEKFINKLNEVGYHTINI